MAQKHPQWLIINGWDSNHPKWFIILLDLTRLTTPYHAIIQASHPHNKSKTSTIPPARCQPLKLSSNPGESCSLYPGVKFFPSESPWVLTPESSSGHPCPRRSGDAAAFTCGESREAAVPTSDPNTDSMVPKMCQFFLSIPYKTIVIMFY